MKLQRQLTPIVNEIESLIEWKIIDATITDSNGNTIFHMPNVEVPSQWSQNATNILAQKYFRKSKVEHDAGERSARQVFRRLAGCWAFWGKEMGLLDADSARTFYDEIYYCLAYQIAAPNSPQWFNTGLHTAYGIEGPASGQWAIERLNGRPGTSRFDSQLPAGFGLKQMETCYVRPQPHACFIQPVNDDLVNPGGIMDLWVKEVRLFKHGSGTGSNFSSIRAKGEKLSGGGVSSGLMSFLEIGDKAAGAIKSGGTTRRAAKMVVVDADHPEIFDFVHWKSREERKAKAMAFGSQHLSELDHGELYSAAWEGEAIRTVSGQNSNNSVRVTDEFMNLVENNGLWHLTNRTDPTVRRQIMARDLWTDICDAAYDCGDPGLQFHDTTNKWHTCKADGAINASNPCSEYLFLDNTACNLASINLVAALGDSLDYERFRHIVKLWTIVLEISVEMASFPSEEIALGSYNYRTLGLGYANLGALLMRNAIPYDSIKGRELAATITAIMTAEAYLTSNKMADKLGPFPRYEANKDSMLTVLHMHRATHKGTQAATFIDKIWDEINWEAGFRNAQVTLIAPTGTISFVMDCDTTGIEPDLSLVKYKNLSGGGTMKIVNQSVEPALKKLGYTKGEITNITNVIYDTGNIEAASMRLKDLAVFDCAFKPPQGQRYLSWNSHIQMCAAVQPFLSGGISKTVNIPEEATVDTINDAYMAAWKLGLKSVSVYRDNSKANQPLNTSPELWENLEAIFDKTTANGELTVKNGRSYLPDRRRGYTQKVKIDGQTVYLRTGDYEEGQLGEIFLTLSREGSTVRSIMESFAKAISIGLQYGVPLDEYVEAFIHTRFEPAGVVEGHPTIKMCSSIVDFVFRDLGVTYLGMSELGQIQAPIPQSLSAAAAPSQPQRSGDICTCGTEMIRTGTCLTCPNCGANFGCG